MEKRQLLLLGSGVLLALAAFGTATLGRKLEPPEREEVLAEPLPEEPADEEAQAEPAESAEPAAPGARAFGPFSLVPHPEDGVALLFGPGDRELAELGLQADVRLVSPIGSAPTLVTVEKQCEQCNPRSRVFLAASDEPREIFDGPGLAQLQDLDRDGTPELMLDRLVAGLELVTLPLRFDGEGFVNGYARFPDGVDRQITNLARAAESGCTKLLEEECRATLEALMTLALFRRDNQQVALFSGLTLPQSARAFVADAEPRLLEELDALVH